MPLVFDSECYRDYYLAAFLDTVTDEVTTYECCPGKELDIDGLRQTMTSQLLVTFNGYSYDLPLALCALKRPEYGYLKRISNAIIEGKRRPWDIEKSEGIESQKIFDHIDLIEVAAGKCSLKAYGGRLHSRRIQDMPIEPDASVPASQREAVKSYCVNDLQTTKDLYEYLMPQLRLRGAMSRKEGVDLRSKSDAQVAEAVIRKRIYGKEKPNKPEIYPGHKFTLDIPDFIEFQNKEMLAFKTAAMGEFVVTDDGGVSAPVGVMKEIITHAGKRYRTGVGGLHSIEEKESVSADHGWKMWDRDVASYYPSIILNLELEPEQIKGKFLEVYRAIVKERLDAKRSGDKTRADSLKITINGSFGKFGSKWSCLYAPKLLMQTTITGQLCLLMLIERITAQGAIVLSANTDGLTFLCEDKDKPRIDSAVAAWEKATRFVTEETEYKSLHARDVNNYIAVKPDLSVKLKGAFAIGGISKNPTSDICVEAIIAFLTRNTPLSETIRSCSDIRKFVTVRAVKGGGMDGDKFLGKAVRWYYSVLSDGFLSYKLNGNKVPRSDGCVAIMELPDRVPSDLDYAWYENEARQMLSDMGVET